MLILVAVSIALLTNSGIFNQAQSAADGMNEAAARDREMIRDAEGTIYYWTGVGEPPAWRDWLQVGDYVDFTPTTATHVVPGNLSGHRVPNNSTGTLTDQTFTTEDLQWRVMSTHDNRITLVSAAPTTNTLTLRGALGYNNAENVLNNFVHQLYNSSIVSEARSMNFEDVRSLLPTNNVETPDASQRFNGVLFREPDPSNLETGTRPGIQNGWDSDWEWISREGNSVENQLVFGPTGSNLQSYFLASRAVFAESSSVTFSGSAVADGSADSLSWFLWWSNASNFGEDIRAMRVRPVVVLNSNI